MQFLFTEDMVTCKNVLACFSFYEISCKQQNFHDQLSLVLLPIVCITYRKVSACFLRTVSLLHSFEGRVVLSENVLVCILAVSASFRTKLSGSPVEHTVVPIICLTCCEVSGCPL